METASHATPAAAANLDAARMALLELGADPSTLAAGIEAAELVAALTQDFDLTVATALHWARLNGLSSEPAADDARLTRCGIPLWVIRVDSTACRSLQVYPCEPTLAAPIGIS